MRDKAQKMVYLNSENYISFQFLNRFYWYIFIIPFFMLIMGVNLINHNGITGKSLFPILSMLIWTFAYWGMVWTIKSHHTKKTFELRFLVNGTVGFFISSLMWLFFASWNLMSDKPFLDFNVFIWMIPAYLIISAIYIFSIVVSTCNGIYSKLRSKSKVIISIPLTISTVAFSGVLVSRFLSKNTNLNIQHIIMTICTVVLVFVPSLFHVNYVKYYYCKKYNITCDANGDNKSQNLYPMKKEQNKSYTKKLLLLLFVIILAFGAINFIKGFINGIT